MRKILMLFIVINMLCIGSVASTSKNDPTININFKNLKIVDFVKMVAKITHKNILVDQKIKGTIDFISVKISGYLASTNGYNCASNF
jgi:general secretion pathway protein D